LSDGNRDGFIKAIGIDIDAVKDAIRISKRDAAPGTMPPSMPAPSRRTAIGPPTQ
jgi:hypothetical protein